MQISYGNGALLISDTRRWVGFTVMVLLYLLRVRALEGFYIVTYALGIYLLHLLVGFLTPQVCCVSWGSFHGKLICGFT